MNNITTENDPVEIETILASSIKALNDNQAKKSIQILKNQLKLNPNPKLFFTIGNIYLSQGNTLKAIKYLTKASKLAPNVAEVFNNLSNAYLLNNEYDLSEDSALKSLSIKKIFPEAWVTLANVRIKKKNIAGSIEALERALSIKPDMYPALINLGNIYFDLNKIQESMEFFHKAIKIKNNCFEAHNGIGLIYNKLGKTQKSIKSFKISLQLNPKNVNALSNLATVHQESGNSQEALILFKDAISFQPDNIDILTNFGHTLQSIGRNEEATKTFKKIFHLNKKNKKILPFLINSEMHICDWQNYTSNMEDLTSMAKEEQEEPIPPFCLANSLTDPKTRLIVAKRFSNKIKLNVSEYKREFQFSNPREILNRKLKVGYISPDYRNHSLGESFLPLIKAHNKNKYTIYGFASRIINDDLSYKIRNNFEHFIDISEKSSFEAARIINSKKIDILIDLAGHTKNNSIEILALKPAPIQAHYLGYGSTIGSDCIDWLITDRVHTSVELMKFCSEGLILLPNSFMSAEYIKSESQKKLIRNQENLPEEDIVFANFNSHSKFDPESFKHWMKILQNVPKSVFWLKRGSDITRINLIKEASKYGIKSDRLIFASRVERKEHILRLSLADICLDNFLHNGGVTTIDSLIAGVPLITLKGRNHSERTGASILSAAGLEKYIARNKEEYVNLCINLATKRTDLLNIKNYIKGQVKNSPLFDTSLLAKNLELGFNQMFKCWLKNKRPNFIKI